MSAVLCFDNSDSILHAQIRFFKDNDMKEVDGCNLNIYFRINI
jgi:hypothetical protein